MQTTVGQILVNSVLPKELKDYSRVMNKSNVKELTRQLADYKDGDLYRQVMKGLYDVGHQAVQSSGASFGLSDLKPPTAVRARMEALKAKIRRISEQKLSDEEKAAQIQSLVSKEVESIDAMLLKETKSSKNPFAEQVTSGSRGKIGDLRSMMLGDMLVEDHKGDLVPVPVVHGYAEGVTPAEFWAGAYGARKGTISTKKATAEAGFLGKQLIQASHREVVTEDNCKTTRGIPVEANDPDNAGTVLAIDAGGYKAGTVITPAIMKELGDDEIIVRSPLSCEANHGVCSRCAGIRERGEFPEVGDNLGVVAAQSLAEPLSQSMLSEKHSGGRAELNTGEAPVQGFDLINQLVQVPKSFRAAAAIASESGTIKEVRDAPQGGKLIVIDEHEHYVPANFEAYVKPGDRVEEGDIMSEGIPNPMEMVKHKGLGAGRLEFVNQLKKAFQDQKLKVSRRNIELIAKGLINHVKVSEVDGPEGTLPNDIAEYSAIERGYRPRYGFKVGAPSSASGKFLEKPALHYSIGTKLTPSVVQNLKKHKVKEIHYHEDPPPFEPQMVRAMQALTVSPDWQVRLGGSYLQRGLTDALHRGLSSSSRGTSYIPGLVRGKDFGSQLEETGQY